MAAFVISGCDIKSVERPTFERDAFLITHFQQFPQLHKPNQGLPTNGPIVTYPLLKGLGCRCRKCLDTARLSDTSWDLPIPLDLGLEFRIGLP